MADCDEYCLPSEYITQFNIEYHMRCHLFVSMWRLFTFLPGVKHDSVVSNFLFDVFLPLVFNVFLINLYSILRIFWESDTILLSLLTVARLNFIDYPSALPELSWETRSKFWLVDEAVTLGIFCHMH